MTKLAHDTNISLGVTYCVRVPTVEEKEQERTKIKKRLFLDTLERSSGRIKATCSHADISRATYYVWRDADPDFKKSVEDILAARGSIVTETLMAKALEGDTRALIYLDKRFNKESGAGKSEIHIYHHTDRKEEVARRSLEDIIDEVALKRRKLAEEGKMPHYKIEEEDE